MIYCKAILPRAGIGNRLFPWARCCVFSHVTGIPMISPSWSQLKLGPLVRRETDLRTYHNIFQSRPNEITGVRSTLIRFIAKTAQEPNALTINPPKTSRNLVYVFTGADGLFEKLIGWESFLGNQLEGMTREKWLKQVP